MAKEKTLFACTRAGMKHPLGGALSGVRRVEHDGGVRAYCDRCARESPETAAGHRRFSHAPSRNPGRCGGSLVHGHQRA